MNQSSLLHASHDRESVSALSDGELPAFEFARALGSADDCHADWTAFHLIGDVLRSTTPALPADLAFLRGFRRRLSQEPARAAIVAAPAAAHARSGPAANDGLFRWKLVAGFASFAAVAAVGLNVAGFMSATPQDRLALATPASPAPAASPSAQPVVVATAQGPVIRDARLEELRAAHRQLGGLSVLQAPSGFLRNADFETSREAGR